MAIVMTPNKERDLFFFSGIIIGSVISALVCIAMLHFTIQRKVDAAFDFGQLDVAVDVLMDEEKDRPKLYLLEKMAAHGHVAASNLVMIRSVFEELKSLRAHAQTMPALLDEKSTFEKSDKILLQSMQTMTDLELQKFLERHQQKFDESRQDELRKKVAEQTAPDAINLTRLTMGNNLSKADQARLASCLEKLEADWPWWKETFNPRAKGLCAAQPVTPAPAAP
jgi:hypothetical protein